MLVIRTKGKKEHNSLGPAVAQQQQGGVTEKERCSEEKLAQKQM
jgi:hypothetical protein